MPNWRELKRFCDRDGWELYKDTDHWFYRKRLDDGTVLYTKVSKGDPSENVGENTKSAVESYAGIF